MNAGQKWDEHWPVPKALHKNPQGKQAFTEQRGRLKHILGNLTLIAGSLNPALYRSPWDVKKAELLRWTQPGLSRELHELEAWAEREILARGRCWGRWLVGFGGIRWGGGLSAVLCVLTMKVSQPATAGRLDCLIGLIPDFQQTTPAHPP